MLQLAVSQDNLDRRPIEAGRNEEAAAAARDAIANYKFAADQPIGEATPDIDAIGVFPRG